MARRRKSAGSSPLGKSSASTSSRLTIAQHLAYLIPDLSPEKWKPGSANAPVWPPDTFALTASLLHMSGAYTVAVRLSRVRQPDWASRTRELGEKWRKDYQRSDTMPVVLKEWWDVLLQHTATPVEEIYRNERLCEALLLLCAAADEASRGIARPPRGNLELDSFDAESIRLLANRECEKFGSTLCKSIHPSRVRVLPKFHTPQSGLTIRSMSHHLALCPVGEVKPFYTQLPTRPDLDSLNLLLLPWPERTTPAQFFEVSGAEVLRQGRYRAFRYEAPKLRADLPQRVGDIMDCAKELVGPVDGVIFPELALRPKEYDRIVPVVVERDAFLLCGVACEVPGDAEKKLPGSNYLQFCMRSAGLFTVPFQQYKHHRWVLDKNQVIQYGLGGRLNPAYPYAEHIGPAERTLNFFALRPALSVCALICEDLARPDPVADVIRAVGPNLVIALLMDGPQLVSRWPARYATVLADDPGSSVLTLTALGMAELSRPLTEPKTSRAIALWKDAQRGGPYQIELPLGAAGVVLSLAVERHEEWTADGRSDTAAGKEHLRGYPILTGVHPVIERRRQRRPAKSGPLAAIRRPRKA